MMSTDWQRWPARLWGDDWIAPMSEVLDINRRTIERWRAGEGEPREALQNELRKLALRPEARAVGSVLRRLSRGETLEDIRRDLKAMQIAVDRVAADYRLAECAMSKFETIPALQNRTQSP